MRSSAIAQLTLVRIKLFYREPEAIFWTYAFPLIMVFVLGLAFKNRPEAVVEVDLVRSDRSALVADALKNNDRFDV